MAEKITGMWDGKEIVLQNAASEATLEKLLETMKRLEAANKRTQQKDNQPSNKKDTKDAAASKKVQRDSESALRSAVNGLSAAAGDLSKRLLKTGSTLSDFTSPITELAGKIPVIGSTMQTVADLFFAAVDSQVNNYRSLSNSGVVFGQSLFDAQRAATRTYLTLDEFTGVITRNTAGLALFGGTASTGSKKLTDVLETLKDDFGTEFTKLGLQAAEQAEYTAEYLGLQAQLGRTQGRTTRDLAAGANSYIMELDKLAKVTGKTREEASKALYEQSLDKRMTLLYSGMEDSQAKAIQGMLAMVDNASPEMGSAIKDMIATGGVPLTDFGRDMLLQFPDLGPMAAKLKRGEITAEEFSKKLASSGQGVDNMSRAQKDQISLMQAMGHYFGISTLEMRKLANMSTSLTKAEKEQLLQQASANAGLLSLSTKLTELRNTIVNALITSGVFEMLEDGIAELTTFFTSGDVINSLSNWAFDLGDAFDSFFNWVNKFNKDGVVDFTAMFADAGKSIASGIASVLADAIVSLFTSPAVIGAVVAGFLALKAASAATSVMTSKLPGSSKGSSGPGLGSTIGKNAGGLLGGLAGGIIEGVGAGLAAIGGKAPLVVAGAAAIGTAIAAIGAGIAGAAWLTGKALPTLTESLEKFQSLDGDRLGQLGIALLKLSLGIAAFGAGGAVQSVGNVVSTIGDGISSLFGGESAVDSMITSINKLGSIDGATVETAAKISTVLKDLSVATPKLDSSKIKSYASAISELASAFKELNKSMAENTGAVKLLSPQFSTSTASTGTSNTLNTSNDMLAALLDELKMSNKLNRDQIAAIRKTSNNV